MVAFGGRPCGDRGRIYPQTMVLTAEHLKSVLRRFHDRLADYREALNRLNVYPVPDGDTGTNMALTLESVMAEVEPATSMDEVAAAMAHGSLMGARGNSGIILSQILRGFAECFEGCEHLGTDELQEALSSASDAAYAAVMRPVEGTILTVVREAAGAARATGTEAGSDVGAFLDRVYRRGLEALERTPELLPVLADAGVVDAGGAGLLLLLAAFVEEVSETEVVLPVSIYDASQIAISSAVPMEGDGGGVSGVAGLRYEVMFLLEAEADALDEFREAWSKLGDSIVIVGGDGTFNCHIHTDDIGASIEAGVDAGRPYRIQVTDLLEQAADAAVHESMGFHPLEGVATAPLGVVAVAAGAGIIERFRQLGVQAVVTGGQSMNPSTEDLLAAVEAMPAGQAVILPNNKNIVPVAGQVDRLSTKEVLVVPTTSISAGMAAMLGYLPDGDGAAVAAAMTAAAADVVSAELTRAVRGAKVDGRTIEVDDWIGLVDGQVAVVAQDQIGALIELAAEATGEDAELITVMTGEGVEEGAVEALAAWASGAGRVLELEVVEGGQPLYPFLLAIE